MDCGWQIRKLTKGIRNVNYKFKTVTKDCFRCGRIKKGEKQTRLKLWNSTVTIILVKVRNLPAVSYGGKLFEATVKFRLGSEKHISKTSWRERWVEQFALHLYEDDQLLEMSLWNRNVMYGRTVLDLGNYPREITQGIWQRLDESNIEIFLMITISGTSGLEASNDLKTFREDLHALDALHVKYRWNKTLSSPRDIGQLTVKVFGAIGLASADFTGRADPFCVVELINARLQTQTEYKTLEPRWNKIFTFNVKDITAVLEFTVYDEDRDHNVEFLGKLVMPLRKIENGIKRWYTLKDKDSRYRAKGKSPQILLEMTVIWNPIRAVIRAFSPKEEKLIQTESKFARRTFIRNVQRFKAAIMPAMDSMRYVQSCFEWESPVRSMCACTLWILVCLYGTFQLIPCMLLLLIFRNFLVHTFGGNSAGTGFEEYDDFDHSRSERYGQKNSLKKRVMAIQEASQVVQNTIGSLASIAERILNTFNFAVPAMTWLAVILITTLFGVLYFVPFRTLLLIWGVTKFCKRFLRPNSVPNNELLDLLSRVPDEEDKIAYYEIAPLPTDWVRRNIDVRNLPLVENLLEREPNENEL